MAAAWFPGLVQAQNVIASGNTVGELYDVRRGQHGTDAYSPFIGRDTYSTPGKAGEAASWRNEGTVAVSGIRSRSGIWLQSVGGHGGKGDAYLSPSAGGAGGDVSLVNTGTIREAPGAHYAYPSPAIWLSSHGGAGGDARLDDSTNGREIPGAGGAGGSVFFSTATSIDARAAEGAVNVLSQGGASGRGGHYRLGQQRPLGVATGGAGGAVTVTVGAGAVLSAAASGEALSGDATEPVSTLRARSIGGTGADGGGTSGALTYPTAANHGGRAGSVRVALDGKVDTTGTLAVGVHVAAIGGHGGRGGDDGGMLNSVAEWGGHGGAGGVASLRIGGAGGVTTHEDDAPAVFVESRGGDGGNAGVATAFGSVVKVGHSGGSGGSVADTEADASVQFRNEGSIVTRGARSVGVTLQSVGGRGADGTPDGGSTAQGGAGGSAGRVHGVNTGSIATEGDASFGLFAQSAGGSGGRGGDGNFINFGGASGGNAGAGGRVVIENTGAIDTQGAGSAGIVAQSVGGGNALSALQTARLTTARPAAVAAAAVHGDFSRRAAALAARVVTAARSSSATGAPFRPWVMKLTACWRRASVAAAG